MKTTTFILSLIALLSLVPLTAGAQEKGDEAPDFTLSTLGGGEFTLSDYTEKVVFIFFFGYGCPHCNANGPNTQNDIYSVYMDNPDFVAIGVDTWDGTTNGVESFKNSTGITYPLALYGSEVESLYQTTYDRIVVVDKEGIIRYKGIANATTDEVSNAAAIIDTYLDMVVPVEENPANNDLKVFYNNTLNQISVTGIPVNAITSFRVFDLTGKNVLNTGSLPGQESAFIRTDELNPGMYIFQAETAGNIVSKKIVVSQ
jgi:peroxiredoxin